MQLNEGLGKRIQVASQRGGTRECRTWWPVPEAKDANGSNFLITVLRNIR